MASIVLMWIGIAFIVIGFLALSWQASKRLAIKDELDRFPERKHIMQRRRNYCLLTILAGMILLVIALVI